MTLEHVSRSNQETICPHSWKTIHREIYVCGFGHWQQYNISCLLFSEKFPQWSWQRFVLSACSLVRCCYLPCYFLIQRSARTWRLDAGTHSTTVERQKCGKRRSSLALRTSSSTSDVRQPTTAAGRMIGCRSSSCRPIAACRALLRVTHWRTSSMERKVGVHFGRLQWKSQKTKKWGDLEKGHRSIEKHLFPWK